MNANKWTAGPWTIDWNVSRLDIFSADATTMVATLRRSTLSPGLDDAAKANARLIAAAPDLAEALAELIEEYDPNMKAFAYNAPRKAKWERARAALAKARGEL